MLENLRHCPVVQTYPVQLQPLGPDVAEEKEVYEGHT